jgi:hypothetical protein
MIPTVDPSLENLTVGDALQVVKIRYPEARILMEYADEPIHIFQVRFPSGWRVSVGFSRTHYCEGQFSPDANRWDGRTMEIAIFDAKGDWFISEGSSDDSHGIMGWQDSGSLFRILDYIQGK